jgi:hypothetical protein
MEFRGDFVRQSSGVLGAGRKLEMGKLGSKGQIWDAF